jgi:putative transposase
VAARTRTAAGTSARPSAELPDTDVDPVTAVAEVADPTSSGAGARVIPFGVFDADAEAESWP